MTEKPKNFATTESDVDDDAAEVTSRLGRGDKGADDARMPDSDSTTGTTPNGEFVGRVAGTDASSAELNGEQSGAEARAAAGDVGPA